MPEVGKCPYVVISVEGTDRETIVIKSAKGEHADHVALQICKFKMSAFKTFQRRYKMSKLSHLTEALALHLRLTDPASALRMIGHPLLDESFATEIASF
jgi:hypothetical protein